MKTTIQLLSCTGEGNIYINQFIDVSARPFSNPKDLDEFDLNIMDLTHPCIWTNSTDSTDKTNYELELSTLTLMAINCRTRVLFILPQNITFRTNTTKTGIEMQKAKRLNLRNIVPKYCELIKRITHMQIDLLYNNCDVRLNGTRMLQPLLF